jgi:hypothetical protein
MKQVFPLNPIPPEDGTASPAVGSQHFGAFIDSQRTPTPSGKHGSHKLQSSRFLLRGLQVRILLGSPLKFPSPIFSIT